MAERRRAKLESDRQDLIRLLSFVENPRAMRVDGELGKSERKWLLEVDRMLDFDDLGLLGVFTRDELVAAEQAFLLLVAR